MLRAEALTPEGSSYLISTAPGLEMGSKRQLGAMVLYQEAQH